jgi:hypothetical protein
MKERKTRKVSGVKGGEGTGRRKGLEYDRQGKTKKKVGRK